MKNVLAIMVLVMVVAACNLTNKLKTNSNSNSSSSSSSSSNPSKIGDEPVERPAPTSAQMAAIANGQEAKWDQQGITWTLPASWKKQEVRNESLSYGGNGAFLTVAISPLPQMENLVDTSLKAMFEGAKTNQKIGKNDEVRWLELDGVLFGHHHIGRVGWPGQGGKVVMVRQREFFDREALGAYLARFDRSKGSPRINRGDDGF